MNKQKGFTLVELLVVIAIIGLLSTLAVISLSNIRERGRDTKRLNDMRNLQQAMELVRTEVGNYRDSGCEDSTAVNIACSDAGDNLLTYLPTVANMKDPSPSAAGTPCTVASGSVCEYAFGPVAPDSYTVYFYLETGVSGYAGGLHTLTQGGIQ